MDLETSLDGSLLREAAGDKTLEGVRGKAWIFSQVVKAEKVDV
jgi:hypothetical protein